MADKDSTPEEGTQVAKPAASSSADKPNSYDPDVLAAEITKKVLASLDPVLDKKVQSTKDQRFQKLENKLSVLDEFEELRAKLGSPEAARAEIRQRQLEEEIASLREGSSTQVASPGTRNEDAASSVALGLLSGFGFQSDDPDVKRVLKENAGDVSALSAGLTTLYKTRQSQPAASPSTIAQPTGLAAPSAPERAQLKQGYVQELQAARNSGNRALIPSIQKKYKDQGLDIENIAFSI